MSKNKDTSLYDDSDTPLQRAVKYHNLGFDKNKLKFVYIEELDLDIYTKPPTLEDEEIYAKKMAQGDADAFAIVVCRRALNGVGHQLFRGDEKKLAKTGSGLLIKICEKIAALDKEYTEDREKAYNETKKTKASDPAST